MYIQVATGTNGGADGGGNGATTNNNGNSKGAGGSPSNSTSNGGGSGEFWVTCPWNGTIKKMVEHPNLIFQLLGQLTSHPDLRNKALKILNGDLNGGGGGGNTSDNGGMGAGDFNLPPSPTMAANTRNLSLFSPHGNDSPGMWSSSYENSGNVAQFRAVPVSFSSSFLFSSPSFFFQVVWHNAAPRRVHRFFLPILNYC